MSESRTGVKRPGRGAAWLRSRAGRFLLVGVLLVLLAGGVLLSAMHVLAEHHIEKAREALSRQKYPQAAAHLHQALRYRPWSPGLHLLAARTARQSGNFQDALGQLRLCRKWGGGETEEQQLEHLMLRAQTGELDAVFDALWVYVEAERPEAPLVLEALVFAYSKLNLAAPATRCIRRWLDLSPDNVQALSWRAWWAGIEGNTILARDSYSRALEIDPSRDDLRLRLGFVYLDAQGEQKALDLFTEVLRKDPAQSDALIGKGKALRGLGRLAEARTTLEDILRANPEDAEALGELGNVALAQGRLEEARRHLEGSLKANPTHFQALYTLSLCLRRLGRPAEADRLKKRLDATDRDMRRAQEILQKELRINPAAPDLYCELGIIQLRTGREPEALRSLSQALSYAPDHQRTHRTLAEYFEKKGDKVKANQHRDWLKPHSSRAHP